MKSILPPECGPRTPFPGHLASSQLPVAASRRAWCQALPKRVVMSAAGAGGGEGAEGARVFP